MSQSKSWSTEWADAWNKFWFTPRSSRLPAIMRIATGSLVLYCLAVWTPFLNQFLGSDGLLPTDYRQLLFDNPFAWSHLDAFTSPTALWFVHGLAILTVAAFTLGWQTRVTGILTALIVISYSNRATGALFGFDQIIAMLTLYLAIADSRLSLRKSSATTKQRYFRGAKGDYRESVSNNIAIRLIQIHLCIVYLFAGLGKCQGDSWWNGEAIWGAMASYEYQTLDMTWLAGHMTIVAVLTLVTLAWEVSYAALIWPRLTRPIMLAMAIPMHLGIGICMGMMTFALAMLVANLAFVPECWLKRWMPSNEPEPEGTATESRVSKSAS